MRSPKHIIIFLLCSALLFPAALGQNKTQLQNKKKKLQKDLNYTQSLLKKNQKNQQASVKQIEKLNSTIESRVELVNNYTEEVNMLAQEINLNEKQVTKLETQLKALKKSYSKMVYQSWKTRNSLSTWMFIFSANNFNQALRRYKYYKQINELRFVQSKSITKNKSELGAKINSLQLSRKEKESAIDEKSKEVATLENEKKEKSEILKKLKKKEKDLLAQVKKQEKERDALASKINSYVEPVKTKKEKTKTTTTNNKSNNSKTNTNSNNSKSEITNTQGNSNSSGFESNKGKLSWPVSKGVITGKFGVHQHPVLDKVEVKNDGIDISTDKGASVRAVYKGTVTGVFKVDGFENVVIVRHGDYLTVYSHLSQTSVSKGTEVSTEQKIGNAATNSEGETYINFQVRYGSAIQNPTSWLTK